MDSTKGGAQRPRLCRGPTVNTYLRSAGTDTPSNRLKNDSKGDARKMLKRSPTEQLVCVLCIGA